MIRENAARRVGNRIIITHAESDMLSGWIGVKEFEYEYGECGKCQEFGVMVK